MPFFIGYAFGLLRAKGFFLFLRLGQETSPACLAGRGPFVQFLQSTLQCSTWNFFFLRYCLFSSVMPLARSGPKANFFSFGSAKAISPAFLAGRAPFVQFLQSTLQCSTWNFFFLRYCLWLAADQRFFSFPPDRPRNQPGLCSGEGAFCPIPAKHLPMFHVELFSSVMLLAFCGPKAFFFSSGSAQETSPACLAGR